MPPRICLVNVFTAALEVGRHSFFLLCLLSSPVSIGGQATHTHTRVNNGTHTLDVQRDRRRSQMM